MTTLELLGHRLANQLLTSPLAAAAPADVVRHLGAVQAQDFPMSRWAVGSRLPASTDAAVSAALDQGALVRTHVLRPTWHLVAADDLRWLLALTADRVRAAMGSITRQVGLTDDICRQTRRLLAQALADGAARPKTDLMAHLQRAGIATDDLRSALLLMDAELAGVVVSGPALGKTITYALLDARVPQPGPAYGREEAVAMLAARYFRSHGPATAQDFAWWSGLTLTDARRGIEANRPTLQPAAVAGQTYWWDEKPGPYSAASGHLLAAFDEYLISYTDRTAAIAKAWQPQAWTKNGMFRPIVVVDGEVVGTWQRTLSKNQLALKLLPFTTLPAPSAAAITAASQRLAAFLGLPLAGG